MPRVGEPIGHTVFPWEDWEKQLKASPTGALYFSSEDFGDMSPRRFREHARKQFRHLGVMAAVRGEEVMVVLNA